MWHAENVRIAARLAIFSAALPLLADPRTQKLLDRLAEEASAFASTAPNLIARETLKQRAVKTGGKRRFHPRVQASTGQPEGPEWQTREIQSEYAFAALGDPPSIRELRKVLSVDGAPVSESDKALADLLRALRSNDDRTRRKLLEDFEKHGLVGAATDFGQLILLSTRSSQEQYEYTFRANKLLGADWCVVFQYKQHEGPGALTVFGAKGRQRPQISGEIWVSRQSYRPLRITLVSTRLEDTESVRDEAEVDYAMTTHGVVAPTAVNHREFRKGQLVAENHYTYTPFQKFGSSADIKFNVK